MAKSAILAVRIVGDAADALKAFDQAESRTKGFQSALDTASVGAATALTAIGGFGAVAVNSASEAEQAFGAVQSVFGDTADEVLALADNAAQAVGLSTTSYNELASVFGAQLGNMGVASGELAGTTDELIGLGADLAATFGGSTADAVGALSSLLRGERDPIEQYGVSIKQADIEAQKAAMGLDGLTGEAERNADMQATLALLYDQTAAAQGQFGREADTAAGQVQRMEAEFQNTVAQLGQQLLPLLSEGANLLSQFAQWVQDNQQLVTNLAIGVAAVSAAILAVNGAMKAFAAVQAIVRTATMVATAAQWAWNAAMAANPIGIIILAIVAIVAAIIWLWANWDQVSAWIVAAWDAVTAWIGQAFDAVVAWIVAAWDTATAWIINAWQSYVVDPVIAAWNTVTGAFEAVVALIRAAWRVIIDWIKQQWQRGVDNVKKVWETVGDAFQAVGDWIQSVIDGIVGGIQNMIGWIQDGINGFLDLIGVGGQAQSVTSAQAAIAPPPLPNAPIWATMAATGGLVQAALAAASAPVMTLAAPAALPTARPRPVSARPTVVNITINGAVDKTGTARELRKLLERYDVITGQA